jgi:hypothetical protein
MSREGRHMPYMTPITSSARMAPTPAVSEGEAQPLGDPFRLIIRDPSFADSILPDQRLQGQIDPDCLLGLHQRGSAPGRSKDHEQSRPQIEPDLFGARRMVDLGEHDHASCLDGSFKPFDRFSRTVAACYRGQTICCHYTHSLSEHRDEDKKSETPAHSSKGQPIFDRCLPTNQKIRAHRLSPYPLDVTASSVSAGGHTTTPQFERDSANGLSVHPTTPYHNYEQFQ